MNDVLVFMCTWHNGMPLTIQCASCGDMCCIKCMAHDDTCNACCNDECMIPCMACGSYTLHDSCGCYI
jgi:hypothetical protein